MRNRAPFLGGNFGLWGGIFSTVDCLLIHFRQVDDPMNAIAAGFITGGVLAFRGGASQAFKQAMAGGVILLMIEGVSNLFTAIFQRRQHEFMQEMQRQELARMKKMMARGGDNPYEVNFSQEAQQSIDGAFDGDNSLGDAAKKSDEGAGGFMDKAKRLSF